MLRWFRGEQPRKPRGGGEPIKPNDLNYQLLKAEIAKEQAEATRQKNEKNAFGRVTRGASELGAAAAQENVQQSFRATADAASDVLDAVKKAEKERGYSE